MKITHYETREDWLEGRKGRITGSSLKDIVSTGGVTKELIVEELTAEGIEFKKADKKEVLEALLPVSSKSALMRRMPKKMGFYKLIAERLAIPPEEGENPMQRGSDMEKEAVAKLEEKTGKKFNTDLVIWSREDNDSIAISPDGFVEGEEIEEAAEIKCLGSANHIKAWYTNVVPDDYWWQVLQYFIVNPSLRKLYFALYDPRIQGIELVVIEITREQVQTEVDEYLEYERNTIAEVNEIVNKLTF